MQSCCILSEMALKYIPSDDVWFNSYLLHLLQQLKCSVCVSLLSVGGNEYIPFVLGDQSQYVPGNYTGFNSRMFHLLIQFICFVWVFLSIGGNECTPGYFRNYPSCADQVTSLGSIVTFICWNSSNALFVSPCWP